MPDGPPALRAAPPSGAARVGRAATGDREAPGYRDAMGVPTDPAISTGPGTAAPAGLPVGVGVALVTMFSSSGRVDAEATAARARECVDRGMTSVLVAGTTGEASRLSADDRILLARAVRDAVGDRPIIVGTGAPAEEDALALSGKVVAADVADALLVYVPETADPPAFFAAVRAAAGAVPVLAYHNPALASAPLEARDVLTYGVAGIKDSSASSDRLATLVELGVPVYVGSVTQLVLAGGCGATGALLAAANVAPSLCVAAWNGDMGAQRALFAVHRRVVADFPGSLKSVAPDAT